MRAGCEDREIVAELVADRGEVAAHGMGAGFEPDDGVGAGDEREEFGAGGGGEFVEDVAEKEGEGGRKSEG